MGGSKEWTNSKLGRMAKLCALNLPASGRRFYTTDRTLTSTATVCLPPPGLIAEVGVNARGQFARGLGLSSSARVYSKNAIL